jgi:GNAT superfamily N-acetyltransferase
MNAIPFDDVWLPLTRSTDALSVSVDVDELTRTLVGQFDYEATGIESFIPWDMPQLPDQWGIGAIVGHSGSGKSTLLRQFGDPTLPHWDDATSIAAHFSTADEAAEKFYAAGLSSVPTWCRPYRVLSNGERFRADLARVVSDGAVIDEFTSVVDRNVAAGASRSLRKFVDRGRASRMVVATVHRDVLPWLQPDWIIDTDSGLYCVKPQECLRRPEMVVEVRQVDRTLWDVFAPHHYLTGSLHPFARCYIASVSGELAAFAAAIPFPHATIRNGWRGTRLVTLPDFQGLGIGPRLSDWVAEAHVRAGFRYYAKTTHSRLGEYRDRHPNWHATSHSRRKTNRERKAPTSFGNRTENAWVGSTRPSYSHQYILEGTR